jgi:hypothetical protein
MLGDRLGGDDAAATAGDDQPQLAFDRASRDEQGVDLGFERLELERQLDRRRP